MERTERSRRKETDSAKRKQLATIESLPHSIEAERSVLGALLLEPTLLDTISVALWPDAFYAEAHQAIYDAMLVVPVDGLDQVTVAAKLEERQQLPLIGGSGYLSHLIADCPTSVLAGHWVSILNSLAYRRKMIEVAGELGQLGYQGVPDLDRLVTPADLYTEAMKLSAKLESKVTSKQAVGSWDYAEGMVTLANRAANNEMRLLPYGYLVLDNMLGGMSGTELIVIGARPRVGKTQIMLEILFNSVKRNVPVLFCSAEMSLNQIRERHLLMETSLTLLALRRGQITQAQWQMIIDASGQASTWPMYFLVGPMTVGQIRAEARRLSRTPQGLGLVIVDYIQLLQDKYDRNVGDNLRERVGYISGNLKLLAAELDIPVIAASQFSRGVEGRADHRPLLSDLKESGEIEADADVVFLLHRNELYENTDKGRLDICIAKTRQHGISGETVVLQWSPDLHCYLDLPGVQEKASQMTLRDVLEIEV